MNSRHEDLSLKISKLAEVQLSSELSSLLEQLKDEPTWDNSKLLALIDATRKFINDTGLIHPYKRLLAENSLNEVPNEPLLGVFFAAIELVVTEEFAAFQKQTNQNKFYSLCAVKRVELCLDQLIETFPDKIKRWLQYGGISNFSWHMRPTEDLDYLVWDELSALYRGSHPKQRSFRDKIISEGRQTQPSLICVSVDNAIQFNPNNLMQAKLLQPEESTLWSIYSPMSIDKKAPIRYISTTTLTNCHTVIVRRPATHDMWMLHVSPGLLLKGDGLKRYNYRAYEHLLGLHYENQEAKRLNIGLSHGDEVEVIAIVNTECPCPYERLQFNEVQFRKILPCAILGEIKIIDVKLGQDMKGVTRRYYVCFDCDTGDISVIPHDPSLEIQLYPEMFSGYVNSSVIQDSILETSLTNFDETKADIEPLKREASSTVFFAQKDLADKSSSTSEPPSSRP